MIGPFQTNRGGRRNKKKTKKMALLVLAFLFFSSVSAMTEHQRMLGLTQEDLVHEDVGLGENATNCANYGGRLQSEYGDPLKEKAGDFLQDAGMVVGGSVQPMTDEMNRKLNAASSGKGAEFIKIYLGQVNAVRKVRAALRRGLTDETMTKCKGVVDATSSTVSAIRTQCQLLFDLQLHHVIQDGPDKKVRSTTWTLVSTVLKAAKKFKQGLKPRFAAASHQATSLRSMSRTEAKQKDGTKCQTCLKNKCDGSLAGTLTCQEQYSECVGSCAEVLGVDDIKRLNCIRKSADASKFGTGVAISGNLHATAIVGVSAGVTFRLDFDTMQFGAGVTSGIHVGTDISAGGGGTISVHAKFGEGRMDSFTGGSFGYSASMGAGSLIKTCSISWSVGIGAKIDVRTGLPRYKAV